MSTISVPSGGNSTWGSGASADQATATPLQPRYPTASADGTASANDILFMFGHLKPSSATMTSSGSWTLVGTVTGGGGSTGSGTGATKLGVWTRTIPGGGLTTTTDVTLASSPNVGQGCIVQLRPDVGAAVTWSYELESYSVSTAAGSYTAAVSAAPSIGIADDDVVLVAVLSPDDESTVVATGVPAVTASGATIGTTTTLTEVVTASGNQVGSYLGIAQVTAGSSASAPTVTGSTSSSETRLVAVLVVRATNTSTNATAGSASIGLTSHTPSRSLAPSSGAATFALASNTPSRSIAPGTTNAAVGMVAHSVTPTKTKHLQWIPSGADGDAVTAGNSGFDAALIGTGNSIVYDNDHVLHGTMSGKFVAAGDPQDCLQWTTSWGSHARAYYSFYIYLDQYPGSNTRFMNAAILESFGLIAGLEIDTTGHLTQKYGDGPPATGESSQPLPLDQWIRIEMDVLASTTVGQFEMRIYYNPDSLVADDEFGVSNVNMGANTLDLIRTPFDSPPQGPMWMAGFAVSESNPPGRWLGYDTNVTPTQAAIGLAAQAATPQNRTAGPTPTTATIGLAAQGAAPSISISRTPGVATWGLAAEAVTQGGLVSPSAGVASFGLAAHNAVASVATTNAPAGAAALGLAAHGATVKVSPVVTAAAIGLAAHNGFVFGGTTAAGGAVAFTFSALAPKASIKVAAGLASIGLHANDVINSDQAIGCAFFTCTVVVDQHFSAVGVEAHTTTLTTDAHEALVVADEYYAIAEICGRS